MPLKTCCFPEVVILCIRTKKKKEKEKKGRLLQRVNTENKTKVTKKNTLIGISQI